MSNDPVTTHDLAEALREAVRCAKSDQNFADEDRSAGGWIEYGDDPGIYGKRAARWQSILDRYDAQVPINPATDHVKEYDPLAWTEATHAAALHYWGMEYYEHDPTKLMEAVSAALYFLAPAIVRQVRERTTQEEGDA